MKVTLEEPSVNKRSGIISVIGNAENLKAEIYEVNEIDQLKPYCRGSIPTYCW